MNFARIALASLGAIAAYFVFGFIMFAALPAGPPNRKNINKPLTANTICRTLRFMLSSAPHLALLTSAVL